MTGEIIKSFLVGLGFDVDDNSLQKFNNALSSAAVKTAAIFASVEASVSAIGYGITEVSQGFEQMGYEYRIISPMINKTLLMRRELLKAYREAGINITRVIQQSVKLNFSIAKTRFAFEALYRSVASRFFTLLTKQSDSFREKLYKNLPKIQAGLERFINFLFKAFEAVTTLGMRAWSILSRIYDFFVELHKATDGWSTIILGVAAAWKLLNLEFLATPLGLILTGLVAILALYDDFKTFQEGGKSLFDWGPVVPFLNFVSRALDNVLNAIEGISEAVFDTVFAFNELLGLNFQGFLASIRAAGGAFGGAISGLFGSNPQNAAGNIQSGAINGKVANPVSSNVQNANTNQNVQQQTTINVQGTPDAAATGRAVAGEQGRTNFDLVRNLRGSTR